tara:strand:- start:225 stop:437 length:213 start_codon:yes stop_codon:yes gene_type:complete
MKTFKQLREARGKMPPGQHISDMKIGKNSIMVHKDKGSFVVYIDNEKLDSYATQQEAEKMAKEFIKQYKG